MPCFVVYFRCVYDMGLIYAQKKVRGFLCNCFSCFITARITFNSINLFILLFSVCFCISFVCLLYFLGGGWLGGLSRLHRVEFCPKLLHGSFKSKEFVTARKNKLN